MSLLHAKVSQTDRARIGTIMTPFGEPEEFSAGPARLRDFATANVFSGDVRKELRAAHDARIAGRPARVGLTFEFWRREHPELMETLPAILEREWLRVRNDIEHEIDAFMKIFAEVVLPAIGPVPHVIGKSPLLKAENALYGRHHGFDDPADEPFGGATLSMTCPLTVDDFIAPFEVDGAGKLHTLIRRFPIIYRSYRDVEGHPSPFSTRGGFECGEGWFGVIRDLSEYLERIAVEIKLSGVEPPIVVQAKEKIGTLSYYVSGVPAAFRDDWMAVYQAASRRSGETCELCGAPGTLRGQKGKGGIGGWIHCYCDSCEMQYQKEREW